MINLAYINPATTHKSRKASGGMWDIGLSMDDARRLGKSEFAATTIPMADNRSVSPKTFDQTI